VNCTIVITQHRIAEMYIFIPLASTVTFADVIDNTIHRIEHFSRIEMLEEDEDEGEGR
jgi:hypothetical protein